MLRRLSGDFDNVKLFFSYIFGQGGRCLCLSERLVHVVDVRNLEDGLPVRMVEATPWPARKVVG